MKRLVLFTYALALLLPLLFVSPAAAQDMRRGPLRNILVVFAPPSQEEEQRISARVGLSAQQKTQMRAVNERYRSDAPSLRAKYDAAYEDVVRLMEASNPNQNEVNRRLRTFNQVHQEVVEREVGYWNDFKKILTPPQNQTFWNMFEQSRIRGN
jgi:Spy/CpxP family protein refolding chaperone